MNPAGRVRLRATKSSPHTAWSGTRHYR